MFGVMELTVIRIIQLIGVRGSKDNKVLRTKKIKLHPEYIIYVFLFL
jgi:hypothetical protein